MASPKELYSDFYTRKEQDPPIIKKPSIVPDAEQLTTSNSKYDDKATFWDTLRNDVAKNLGGVLGFPVDLINSAMNLGTGSYSPGGKFFDAITDTTGLTKDSMKNPGGVQVGYPFMGSRNFQDALGYDPNQKPGSYGQHVGSTLLAGAMTTGPFGVGKGAIPLAGEVLSGAGSGAGQIVAEMVPDNPYVPRAVTEVVAQVAGGLGPTMMAGRVQAAKDLLQPTVSKLNLDDVSAKGVKAAGLKLRDSYAQKYVDERLKGSLEGMDPNKVVSNIDEASRLEGKFPGLNYTLGQRTGSPEVRSLEMKTALSSGKNLNERVSMDVANRERMAQEANNVPKSSITWDEALDQPRQQIQGAMADIDSRISKLDDQMDNLVKDSAGAAPEKVGTQLRMIRGEEKATAKAATQRQFAEVENLATKYKAHVESDGIMSLVEEKLADPIFKFDPSTVPSVFQKAKELQVVNKMNKDSSGRFIGGSTAKVSFNEAKALREAVGQDIGAELSASRVNPRRLRSLFEVRSQIDKAMDTMGATQFPDLNAAYKTAIKDYREKYVPRFERGVNLKMQILNSLGDMRIPNEGVVKAYFKPNGITPIRQFKELFGDHPAAVEAMENGVMNMFSKDVVKDGIVNQAKYDTFIGKYGSVLDELPNLKQKISNVGSAAESIASQRATLFEQQREISNGTLAKLLRVEDPSKVLNRVLADPKVMTETVKALNPAGRQALTTSLMTKAFDESKMATTEFVAIDPVKFGSWLDRNEQTLGLALKATYGEKAAAEHMANLRDIQKATSFIERTPVSVNSMDAVPNVNVDPLKKSTGISTSSVFAAARAATAGRGGAHYFAGIFGGQLLNFMSQKQIAEMTRQALYDPATAKTLVEAMKKPALSEEVRKGLNTAASKLGYLITGGPSVPLATAKKLPAYGINSRTQQLNPPEQNQDQSEESPLNLNLSEE